MATRIVIANRSRLERELILQRFQGLDQFTASGAPDSEHAIAMVATQHTDVVVLPVTEPDFFVTVKTIRSTSTDTTVIASAVPLQAELVTKCAKAGIKGYIDCEATLDEWAGTVQDALTGRISHPVIAGILLQHIAQTTSENDFAGWPVGNEVAASAQRVGLTPRERQIVGLIDQGLSNKAIARQLHVEPSTVKNHVHAILQKYGVRHRGEAAARFRKLADVKRIR